MTLITMIFVSVLTNAQVQIIGHRGASYLAPENTVASARLAWELGADAVEVDIYLTADNKVICLHDANTKRTTGQDFAIKETSSRVLRKLDAGSFKDEKYRGEKIPFLREVIKTIPQGKELVVELKCGSEVLPYLKKDIERYGRGKRFVFICFDFKTITDTKKVFPENSCYWLCSNRELFNQTLPKVPEADLQGVSLSYSIITPEVAEMVRNMDLELFVWTVNNTEEAKRLIGLGVKGITTDRPGWLREQLSGQ
ncbi:MAG TPA: glycerophosphodiester phosphodiesterase [Bacteroidales bacterium]|nr:glycerophosphodiester phosphodiesterase [Bacteroidales bacterium]